MAIAGATAAAALFGCGGEASAPEAAADRSAAAGAATSGGGGDAMTSHQKMLALLADVERRTPEENLYLGDRPAREALAALDALGPSADPLERWRKLRDVGLAELNRANEVDAVSKLEEAVAMLPALGGRVPDDEAKEARFRLGVAWLRRGESQNCALRHNAESCILPIRGRRRPRRAGGLAPGDAALPRAGGGHRRRSRQLDPPQVGAGSPTSRR